MSASGNQLLRENGSATICAEGGIPATPLHLDRWMKTLLQPLSAAMEATMFAGVLIQQLQSLANDRLTHSPPHVQVPPLPRRHE